MSELLTFVFLFIATLLGVGYYYVRKQYAYFRDRNIPYIAPIFPFGSLKGFGSKYHSTEVFQKAYNQFAGKDVVAGMFFLTRPIALAIDPEFIKTMFIRDFNTFGDRGMYHDEEIDPLSAHLFSLEGSKWRKLRNKLSPTFTSGKMKLMFDIIANASEAMSDYLKDAADKGDDIEFRDLFGRYNTDVIGNCAFGIECNSMDNPENEFRQMGRKIFQPPAWIILIQLIAITFPNIAKRFRVKMMEPDVTEFFLRIVRENLDYRKANNVKRNDFFQLLMDLEKSDNKEDKDGLSFNEITAQAFIFFIAGFETSSTTLSFCLFELGRHVEMQEKVRDEIESVLKKHDGKVTYEALSEMTYLNQVINETLRLYPPVDALFRIADKDYTIPETSHNLTKGLMYVFPIFAIQRDPRHFPDPLKFDPDRFTDEEIAKRHQFAYLPFGEGPRNCIGMRFGLMQVRLGVISILRKYKVSHSAKTPKEVKFVPASSTPTLEGGVWLKVAKV